MDAKCIFTRIASGKSGWHKTDGDTEWHIIHSRVSDKKRYEADMTIRSPQDATPEAVKNLAEMNLDQAVRIQQLEAMIDGLFKALNPLLEEWKKLKSDK